MWLPDPLYKIIPVTYAVLGGLTIWLLESWVSVLSGLALISAGMLVWRLRVEYRRATESTTD